MSDKKQTDQTESFGTSMIINGKPATRDEIKRIMRAPAPPSDKNDRATKKISQVDRGFNLMR